jgi:hypothetical protein
MRQPRKLVNIMALNNMANISFFGFTFQRGGNDVSFAA